MNRSPSSFPRISPSRRQLLSGLVSGAFTLAVQPASGTGSGDGAAHSPRRNVTLQNDPLPSWNDGAAKQAILDFVAAVTTESGDQFVPENDRIAVFDNDGTLWTEKPFYAQLFFALAQVTTLAPDHPEWQTEHPFASILAGDTAAMKQFTEAEVGQIIAATHAGMTTTAFNAQARA